MPIFRNLRRAGLALALGVLLLGCSVGPTADGRFPSPIPQSVQVAVGGVPLTIAAPPGYCVDRATVDENPRGVFMFLSDCQRVASTGLMARMPLSAILTASISPTGLAGSDAGLKPALGNLGEFLASPIGLFSMGKSNVDGAVKILTAKRSNVALYLLVEDSAFHDPAGASNRYWRAFTEINGRVVTLSVTSYARNDPDEARALRVMRAFMQATRDANPPLVVASGS